MTIYRKYRRMTEDEQKATGYRTEYESMGQSVSPIEIELGFDPFVTYDVIESVTSLDTQARCHD
jgi:hypothetical protein